VYWHTDIGSLPHFFAKCPFEDRCSATTNSSIYENTTCTGNSTGTLCGACESGFYLSANKCEECGENTAPAKLGVFFTVILVLSVLLFMSRGAIRRIQRRYGYMWRNVLRIFTINLAYAQINTALPTVISLPLPRIYLEFLENWNWVNVDLFSLLSLKCINSKFDFRGRVVLATLVPVCMILVFAVNFFCQRQALMRAAMRRRESRDKSRDAAAEARGEKIRVRAIEYVYSSTDVDEDGYMDEHEFVHVLGLLHVKRHHKISHDVRQVRALMKQLGGVPRRAVAANMLGHHHHQQHQQGTTTRAGTTSDGVEMTLSHEALHNCAVAGTTDEVFGPEWIAHAEIDRAWRNTSSVLLIVLFLLHAPVSQRFVYYFACQFVDDERSFLRSDYSVECYQGDHLEFASFAVFMIIVFTFLLPLTMCGLLCRHRKSLHTAAIRQRYGFLYKPFNRGAEFWEILEVFRKLSLTGLLVFVTDDAYRAVTAVLICVVSVANLNYLRPHKNWLVFLIAECSFLLSTFKYLALVLLNSPNGDAQRDPSAGGEKGNSTGTAQSVDEKQGQEFLGMLLVVLDVVFVLASSISVLALVWLLRKDVRVSFGKTGSKGKGQDKKNTNKKKILPVTGSEDATTRGPKSAGGKFWDPTMVTSPSGEETAVHFAETTEAAPKGKGPDKMVTEEKVAGMTGTPATPGTLRTPGTEQEAVGIPEKQEKSVGHLPAPSTTVLPVESKQQSSETLAVPAIPQKPKTPALDTRKQKKKNKKKLPAPTVPTATATNPAKDDDEKKADTNQPSAVSNGMVEIAVPKGAHPGQNVTVKLDGGHVIHAKVPRGLKPGMIFTVPIASQENHAEL
jgi:hypothetical protein